jgi:hypothetical protein
MKQRCMELLRCIAERSAGWATPNALVCVACGTSVPIRAGISRFLDESANEPSRRTQNSVAYELVFGARLPRSTARRECGTDHPGKAAQRPPSWGVKRAALRRSPHRANPNP